MKRSVINEHYLGGVNQCQQFFLIWGPELYNCTIFILAQTPFLEIWAKPFMYTQECRGRSLGWCWEGAGGKLGGFWLMTCFGETLYSKLLPTLFCITLQKVIFCRCLANWWISSAHQVNPFSYSSKQSLILPLTLHFLTELLMEIKCNSHWAHFPIKKKKEGKKPLSQWFIWGNHPYPSSSKVH